MPSKILVNRSVLYRFCIKISKLYKGSHLQITLIYNYPISIYFQMGPKRTGDLDYVIEI